MNIRMISRFFLLFAVAGLTMVGCREKDAPLPDNLLTFEASSLGLGPAEEQATITLKLSRATDRDITVTLKVTNLLSNYTSDYTTVPATNGAGELVLTIPSGNNQANFIIKKTDGALFDGDEKVQFEIYSSSSPVIIGVGRFLEVAFAELMAETSSLVMNGGGATFPNKVFIDLSANRQTIANRTSWDLGFYSGSDDFRAVLNSSVNMMVKQTAKTNMADVTAADTIGLSNEVAFSQTDPTPAQLAYIDNPTGDLTKTAIAQVATNDADNKVYLVNRGTGIGSPGAARGWKKIRVLRNASGGYTLQHADLNSATFTTVDIAKDNNFFFRHVSFETGIVKVEPEKGKWDIAWTYFANATNLGTGDVPYLFQDIVLINRNVEIAKVMTTVKTFEAFTVADMAGLTYMKTQNAISSDWRSGGGPGVSPAVRADRYYIVKDGAGNAYKLRFTALTQNGERGYPAFEAVLLK